VKVSVSANILCTPIFAVEFTMKGGRMICFEVSIKPDMSHREISHARSGIEASDALWLRTSTRKGSYLRDRRYGLRDEQILLPWHHFLYLLIFKDNIREDTRGFLSGAV
jgi:hypothetical protein